MKIRPLRAFLLAASLTLPSLATPAGAVTEAEMQRLEQGEVLVHAQRKERGSSFSANVTASILIDAPADAVWAVLNDKEAAPEYTDGLLRADIIADQGNVCLVEQEMKVPQLPGTFVYTIQYQLDPPHRMDFQRHSGDLKDIRGSWQLKDLGGNRTLVVYNLRLNPGMLVPRSIVNYSLQKSLPDVMVAVRHRVLSLN